MSSNRLVGLSSVAASALIAGCCLVALNQPPEQAHPDPVPVQPKPKIEPKPQPAPEPDCPGPNCPRPKPGPQPGPRPQPKPWGPHALPSVDGYDCDGQVIRAGCPCGPVCPCGPDCQCPGCPVHGAGDSSSWVNGRTSNGEVLTADFPAQEWMKNTASHGAGMCVMTSIEMCARFLGLEQYRGLRDWCAAQEAGGGWPEKVARQIPAFERAHNIPAEKCVPFIQYEGRDVGPLLEEIDRAGLMAGVTYGRSPRYGRGSIAHMVATCKCGKGLGVILDNNPIGGVEPPDHLFEWMSREEMLARIVYPRGEGWVFAWLAPPAPPVPRAK